MMRRSTGMGGGGAGGRGEAKSAPTDTQDLVGSERRPLAFVTCAPEAALLSFPLPSPICKV